MKKSVKNIIEKNKRKTKISPKIKKNNLSLKKETVHKEEFKWTPKISVNDRAIDSQHQRLLHQIDVLITELSRGQADLAVIRDTLGFLGKYIQEHLKYEEDYMKKINYPKFKEHKKIHENFVKFFENYKKELNSALKTKEPISGRLKELAEKARKFLGAWWINHIGIEDHKYAEFAAKTEKGKIVEKYFWKAK